MSRKEKGMSVLDLIAAGMSEDAAYMIGELPKFGKDTRMALSDLDEERLEQLIRNLERKLKTAEEKLFAEEIEWRLKEAQSEYRRRYLANEPIRVFPVPFGGAVKKK